ncbi:hypothetical protein [Actinokineospora enzanensis]|uniref:hypothetical protein n=1 Tax=Actinokineospora enzanensis TaxID=155975 RepID=UPI000A076516|nr:hypothetical protein [Actinokineospora enzanensis]
MIELALTEERRKVLAALLNDEERLRVEYPKVDDYLSTALGLPGTGDNRIDNAFDLRFVHYVTGGRTESENPYWDIVSPFVHECDGRRLVNAGHSNGSGRLAYAQMLLQGIFAYAIPSPETIEWIAAFCAGRPMIELGAGRGYWAAQITRAGVSVQAYDSSPPDKEDNSSFSPATGQIETWHHVGNIEEFDRDVASRPGYVLLLCWPPGWGAPMASEALAAFERAGGERLIFVGQHKGGMTGDDAFFEALSNGWTLESEDSRHVSWWNIPDVAEGWVRR